MQLKIEYITIDKLIPYGKKTAEEDGGFGNRV